MLHDFDFFFNKQAKSSRAKSQSSSLRIVPGVVLVDAVAALTVRPNSYRMLWA